MIPLIHVLSERAKTLEWELGDHHSRERLVLERGKSFVSAPLTDNEYDVVSAAAATVVRVAGVTFKADEPFLAAQMLAIHDPCLQLRYVEGFVHRSDGGVNLHAWVTINDKVVDLTTRTRAPMKGDRKFAHYVLGTFPEVLEYRGIVFNDRALMRARIIANGEVRPFLTGRESFPDDGVAA